MHTHFNRLTIDLARFYAEVDERTAKPPRQLPHIGNTYLFPPFCLRRLPRPP